MATVTPTEVLGLPTMQIPNTFFQLPVATRQKIFDELSIALIAKTNQASLRQKVEDKKAARRRSG